MTRKALFNNGSGSFDDGSAVNIISTITSSDSSIAVSNPSGPTTDLTVVGGGGGGPVAFVGCAVTHSTTQSFTSGTPTLVSFDTEEYDTNGFHSTSTNNPRMTIPTSLDGYYLVTAWFPWAASNNTARRFLDVFKNGTSELWARSEVAGGSSASEINHSLSTVLKLVATDFVQLMAFQNAGVSIASQHAGGTSQRVRFQISMLGT